MITTESPRIQVGRYNFLGPYFYESSLQNSSGVYVILDKLPDGRYRVIDVGESGDVRNRVENHERRDCWERNCSGQPLFAAYYTSEGNRMAIERELRNQYNPPCGER